jgi:hypothetical protein
MCATRSREQSSAAPVRSSLLLQIMIINMFMAVKLSGFTHLRALFMLHDCSILAHVTSVTGHNYHYYYYYLKLFVVEENRRRSWTLWRRVVCGRMLPKVERMFPKMDRMFPKVDTSYQGNKSNYVPPNCTYALPCSVPCWAALLQRNFVPLISQVVVV